MDKIYLVQASSGSYDDYGTHIIKCFENKEDAEKYSEKYDRVIRKISDFHASAWVVVMDYDEDEDDAVELNIDFNNKIWSKYNYKFSDYNDVTIIELDVVEHRRKTNLKTLLD